LQRPRKQREQLGSLQLSRTRIQTGGPILSEAVRSGSFVAMNAFLLSALALTAADPLSAREIHEPSPAEADCDEQLGDFRREGAKVYCEINGVLFEGREALKARAVPLGSLDAQRDHRGAPTNRAAVQGTKRKVEGSLK
jgi:hypothetical protein